MQIKIPASFWRGGTSRAVFFKEEDLASYDVPTRDLIILAALGSPDPYGRQVDGLGGGISSLSKVGIRNLWMSLLCKRPCVVNANERIMPSWRPFLSTGPNTHRRSSPAGP